MGHTATAIHFLPMRLMFSRSRNWRHAPCTAVAHACPSAVIS